MFPGYYFSSASSADFMDDPRDIYTASALISLSRYLVRQVTKVI